MPFLKLANNHRCDQPKTRPDGKPLVVGDVWMCDAKLREFPGEKSRRCNKTYEWQFDQREGGYWKPCVMLK
jgi:hypothetical protein